MMYLQVRYPHFFASLPPKDLEVLPTHRMRQLGIFPRNPPSYVRRYEL